MHCLFPQPILTISGVLFFILCGSNMLHAQDKTSIRIACVIPSTPGVNTPVVTENKAKRTPVRDPLLFQKETREQRNVNGNTQAVIVRTVYER